MAAPSLFRSIVGNLTHPEHGWKVLYTEFPLFVLLSLIPFYRQLIFGALLPIGD